MDRDRSNWTSWATRISNEDSDYLLKNCHILLEKDKITKVDKYISTFHHRPDDFRL